MLGVYGCGISGAPLSEACCVSLVFFGAFLSVLMQLKFDTAVLMMIDCLMLGLLPQTSVFPRLQDSGCKVSTMSLKQMPVSDDKQLTRVISLEEAPSSVRRDYLTACSY
ncbi:hypothetical protein IQ06DRAFT_30553 [Phaeosphaeriaceae sp. SRC1lsM3a]|nr:hypothetical protein IQ06DRAFT_30553 [Stagonospora sp. SRC1lsM3a]